MNDEDIKEKVEAWLEEDAQQTAITNEVDLAVAEAMTKEKILVSIGKNKGDEGLEDGSYKVDRQVMQVELEDGVEYIKIPVTLYVPYSGYDKTYSATYHVLSDDATLKPSDPGDPDRWDVEMGMQGYSPVTREQGDPARNEPLVTYTYEVSHAVTQANLFAYINHDHEGTKAQAAIYRTIPGGGEVSASGIGVRVLSTVDLDMGVNDFVVRVTSERGTVQRYLLRVVRRSADLSLDWVRVNNSNVVSRGDGTYLAYVPIGTTPDVTAIATDRYTGRTFIERSFADGAPTQQSDRNIAIGKAAELQDVVLNELPVIDDQGHLADSSTTPVKLTVRISDSSTVERSGTAPADPDPVTTYVYASDGVTVIGGSTTTVRHTTGGDGIYTTTTTIEQWRDYSLDLVAMSRDAVNMYVDVENNRFDVNTSKDPKNPRAAWWDAEEAWADNDGTEATAAHKGPTWWACPPPPRSSGPRSPPSSRGPRARSSW